MIPVQYLLDLAASIHALRLEDRYVSEEDYQRLFVRHLRLIVEIKELQREAARGALSLTPSGLPASALGSLN